MQNIGDYLKKFQSMVPHETRVKKVVRAAIFKHTGIKVPADKVSVKGKSIFLMISPTKKTEIFLRKEKILETLKGEKVVVNSIN